MSDREFIYRHQAAAPWNKTDGASLRLPVKDDAAALAVSFVYWPKGGSDGSAHAQYAQRQKLRRDVL